MNTRYAHEDSQLIHRTIVKPYTYGLIRRRKLIHAFNFFNLDYQFALAGYSFPPKSVCLILTEKCNLKCAMCDIGQRNAEPAQGKTSPLVKSISNGDEEMSLDNWRTLFMICHGFSPNPASCSPGQNHLCTRRF